MKRTTEELKIKLAELEHDKKYLFDLDRENRTNRFSGKINTLENKIAKIKKQLKTITDNQTK